jgi:hypothetical protein
MKTKTALRTLILLMLCAAICRAEETLSFKTVDGREYKNVTINRVDASGLQVATDDGIERIPAKMLPPDLQKRFGFDPAAAAAYDAKVAAMQRQAAIQDDAAQKAALQGAPATAPAAPAAKGKSRAAKNTAGAQDAPSGSPSLPAPIQGHTYTLSDLEKEKFDLEGKVVWARLSTELNAEQISKTEYKVFVSDGSGAVAFVYFPREAVDSMDLLTKRGPTSFFVLVSPNKYTAVGRSVARDINGVGTYRW